MYDTNPSVTLFDIERSVEQGIDVWLACITNMDEPCAQLEILTDKYMMHDDCPTLCGFLWQLAGPRASCKPIDNL